MKLTRAQNFGTFFIPSQTAGRAARFQVDETAQLFLRVLYCYAAQGHYALHEFVVMLNHFHAIITPIDIPLERTLQLIKGELSRELGKRRQSKLELWQRGFSDHRIRDYEDFLHPRDYIHQNPVKAGYCSGPEDFPYSSANPRYKLDPIPQRLKPVALVAERHG